MAFDQDNQGIPTPNINPQPTEQDVRTMRADLGTPVGLPTFDAEEPAFTPETTNQIPSVDQLVAQGGGSKKPLWLIGGVAGFIVLGLVGYFFVAPMFNKAPSTDTATPTGGKPTVTPITPIKPVAVHKTQFINPPVATVTAVIQLTGPNDIKGVLASQGQMAKPGITEIIFLDRDGAPIESSKFLALFLNTVPEKELTEIMDKDLTAFIYKDNMGVWPGYVLQMKQSPTSSTDESIEGSAIKNFFVVDPGTLAPFKNGIVNNLPDRYSPGTTPGASFGYVGTKNKLLISTSYAGMKEALRLMGL